MNTIKKQVHIGTIEHLTFHLRTCFTIIFNKLRNLHDFHFKRTYYLQIEWFDNGVLQTTRGMRALYWCQTKRGKMVFAIAACFR